MPGSDQSRPPVDGVCPELLAARDELKRLVLIEDFPAAVELGEALLKRKLSVSFEADIQFLVARAWVRLSDGGKGQPHAQRAREIYEADGNSLMVAEALLEEARALFFLADPRTLVRALQALDLCDHLQLEEPDLRVRIFIHTGLVYYRYGDWAKAIDSCDQALEHGRNEANLRLLARIHTILAFSHLHLGDHSTALSHGRRGLALFSRSIHPMDKARAEHNLGLLYVRVGRLQDADRYLTSALDLVERNPNSEAPLHVDLLCALAELHLARHELEAAEASLSEAADVADRWHVLAGQAEATHLTARLLLQRGEFGAADAAFAQAVARCEKLSLTDRLADCHREHAHALREQGRMEEAIEHMQAAYEAASDGPNKLAAALRAEMEAGSPIS